MGCSNSTAQKAADEPKVEVKATPSIPKTVPASEFHKMIKKKGIKAAEIKEILNGTPSMVEVQDDISGNRPLHTAAEAGNLELIKLFVEKKADVNAKNKSGNTPLHHAIGFDNFDCAIQLKISGADDAITNSQGFASRRGINGNKSYGVAALAASQTLKQIDIAFKICDSAFVDACEKDVVIAASEKAKSKMKDLWNEECDKKLADLLAKFDAPTQVVLEQSSLSCAPKGGFLKLLECSSN